MVRIQRKVLKILYCWPLKRDMKAKEFRGWPSEVGRVKELSSPLGPPSGNHTC